MPVKGFALLCLAFPCLGIFLPIRLAWRVVRRFFAGEVVAVQEFRDDFGKRARTPSPGHLNICAACLALVNEIINWY